MAELLQAGKSLSQIASNLGIAKSTACYHKRRLGLPMRPECAQRYDWPAIQRYYDAGHSMRDCRAEFGFAAQSWADAVNRGAIVPRPQAVPMEELLISGRPRSRNHIKRRLFASGMKEHSCENCGISEWREKPLSMALHHINGDGLDNRLENLRLLCPNCHSQTPNFAAKKYARASAAVASSNLRPTAAER